jgi:hypothetical protein
LPNKPQTLLIDQLGGVVTALPDGAMAPDVARNVLLDRRGGYIALGATVAQATSFSANLIGYDDGGLASFVDASGNLGLYDGGAYQSGGVLATSPIAGEALTHIDGFGGYYSSNQFLGRSLSGDLVEAVAADVPTTSEATSGGALPDEYYQTLTFAFVRTAKGNLVQSLGNALGDTHDFTAEAGDDNSITVNAPAIIAGGSSDYRLQVLIRRSGNTTTNMANAQWTEAGSIAAGESLIINEFPIAPTWGTTFWTSGFRNSVMANHQQRTWGVLTADSDRLVELPQSKGFVPSAFKTADLSTPLTLMWSRKGWMNVWDFTNWLRISATSSSEITGLVSSPAGLLVFCQHETFLVQGDPDDASGFGITLLSGVAGHDGGTFPPSRVGGSVFSVTEGRVMGQALNVPDLNQSARVTELSEPVYDRDDPFVQVVVEPVTETILALTEGSKVYRFDPKLGQWADDAYGAGGVSGFMDTIRFLLPNSDLTGVRYCAGSGGTITKVTTVNRSPTGFDDVVLTFKNLDMGDRNRLKVFRRIEMFMDNAFPGTITLSYDIEDGKHTGTIPMVDEGNGRFFATYGAGLVGAVMSITFTISGMVSSSVVEPPIVIHFHPRRRDR